MLLNYSRAYKEAKMKISWLKLDPDIRKLYNTLISIPEDDTYKAEQKLTEAFGLMDKLHYRLHENNKK